MSNKKVDFGKLKKEDLDKSDDFAYVQKFDKGLSKDLVRHISREKKEPKWMLDLRLKALQAFYRMEMPSFGPSLKGLNLEEICYYAKASKSKNAKNWDDVDPKIKETFERLKIPEAERSVLAGAGAQYESENVYHNIKKQWKDKGIIFEDFDIALQKYPQLVKKYFGKCVGIHDHKFAALHYAVCSGGTFLYIPEGVNMTEPLQAYFRMNSASMGQFEHTLIVIDKNAKGSYIEGCSAPKFGQNALHAGCVEVFVGDGAQFRYSSVENWSKDTYNLNTKRAIVGKDANMEWIGGQMGSKVTMLYPCSILKGDNSSSDYLGLALAGEGQNQDTGAKVIINGKNCKANILSKSISIDGGISSYRGIAEIKKSSSDSLISVECDALVFGQSKSNTFPLNSNKSSTSAINHEAKTGKISEELLFYLESRGISEDKAKGLIVNGFLSDIVKTLPLEYAVEMNRLIEMQMEGF